MQDANLTLSCNPEIRCYIYLKKEGKQIILGLTKRVQCDVRYCLCKKKSNLQRKIYMLDFRFKITVLVMYEK